MGWAEEYNFLGVGYNKLHIQCKQKRQRVPHRVGVAEELLSLAILILSVM